MSKAIMIPSSSQEITPHTGRRRLSIERGVREAARDWIETLRGKRGARPNTVELYERHIAAFVNFLEGEGIRNTAAISPDSLRAYNKTWVDAFEAGTYKSSTINNHYAPIRKFLTWLIAERAVFLAVPENQPDAGDPWITEGRVRQWLASFPEQRGHMKKENAVTVDEARKLIAAVSDPRDRALFSLMLGSGVRVSEACALRACDVRVRKDKAGIVSVENGKGGKSRDVTVDAAVLAPVVAWAKIAGLRLGDASDKRPLWPGDPRRKERLKKLSRFRIHDLLSGYARAAGLRHFSPHNLRHHFGTELYRQTRDPHRVANELGHAGLGTVNVYVNAVEVDDRTPYKAEWANGDQHP